MHSHSYGTMLDGDTRLLCSATMPRTTAMQSPLPGLSKGLGEPQIWLVTAISCSAQPQPLVLGEDVPSPEAFAGQALAGQTQCWPWAHGEREVGLRISRGLCQLAFLWSYCLSNPGPIQSKCSCEASLDTHCCFCHSLFGLGICGLPGSYPSEFLL